MYKYDFNFMNAIGVYIMIGTFFLGTFDKRFRKTWQYFLGLAGGSLVLASAGYHGYMHSGGHSYLWMSVICATSAALCLFMVYASRKKEKE